MFARLVFCKFSPDRIKEVRKIYHGEITPVIRKQKGNLGVSLLEPTDKSSDFISITQWKSRADADAYESSGTYKKMLSKVENFFIKQPELRTYNIEEISVGVRETL